MARLIERGLRRSVGVPGLFATAYGNVGSSIYYALGLVAAHALGLTPVVFMLAGGLFALTAKTYAEGAPVSTRGARLRAAALSALPPNTPAEAPSMSRGPGGPTSFPRHAFNELASF